MTPNLEPIYILIGAKIRMLREALGVSQEELASRIKLSRAALANLELGRQRIHIHTLDEIARALGTTSKHLLRGIIT